ncbi:hypothetical protein [Chryseobacterium caseinilyticum]|uniref:Uncharacterized protein n=1 Tax=Chryseobacterium caseinilyticum TaxID=2771428 RepID=A0ABR8Z9L5_9FLAO|nr:hypothetical protein [Chryseobacterium caseinilyticum]MBD8081980.1 hypothetical protein [Chryseobacterium caseinilyticum]
MKETIKKNVIAYIASFANLPVQNVEDENVLKSNPLNLDDVKLGFLAIALRAYLKSLNPNQTILVSQLRKNGFTVKKTYELVIEKYDL